MKIYFDMAGYEGGMNAVKCALTTISPERMVFGTDYPYNFRDDPQGVKQVIENIRKLDLPPQSEAVSQFVIPAKPHETGREPGSRSPRDDAISLDSGSRYAARRSSGMTGLRYYDTVSP